MDDLKKLSKHAHFQPVLVFFVVAVIVLLVVVQSVINGSGPSDTKASRNTFLTQSDDALSLEQDLNSLGQDPAGNDETELNSLQ